MANWRYLVPCDLELHLPATGSNLDPILKFDASGKLIKSFGAGLFVFPHELYVDRNGDVWVTDGLGHDGKGQQVIKFSPDGQVMLKLGKAGVAGNGPGEFNAPSAVVMFFQMAIYLLPMDTVGIRMRAS